MVEPPFALLEVEKEFIPLNSMELGEPHFSKAPKAFNAVDVAFSAGEFIAFVVNAVVAIAIGEQAVVSVPGIGEHVAFGEDVATHNGHQCLL